MADLLVGGVTTEYHNSFMLAIKKNITIAIVAYWQSLNDVFHVSQLAIAKQKTQSYIQQHSASPT